MNRLQAELQRLYHLEGGAHDQTRCMVLALGQPADWEAISKVWQGVQADLGWPAPAIAVSGVDGYQVWFSLSEAWPAAQVTACLASLRARYLPGMSADRISLMTQPPVVPALQTPTGNWSAFVASDLAPVFADTPWLDIPPNEDGQATLLRALAPMKPAAFSAAMLLLAARAVQAPPLPTAATSAPVPHLLQAPAAHGQALQDPRHFLLQVMNDATVALPLRIDAAKALLPYLQGDGHRPSTGG